MNEPNSNWETAHDGDCIGVIQTATGNYWQYYDAQTGQGIYKDKYGNHANPFQKAPKDHLQKIFREVKTGQHRNDDPSPKRWKFKRVYRAPGYPVDPKLEAQRVAMDGAFLVESGQYDMEPTRQFLLESMS